MKSRCELLLAGFGVMGLLAGCQSGQQSPATSRIVWQEGESVASVREGLEKVADTGKAPASSGAVLHGQALSPKDASVSWKVSVPRPIERAVMAFRYGRLHWRADMKPPVFTLELDGAGQRTRQEITFQPTRGWGAKPGDYALLFCDIGPVAAGDWTVKLTSATASNDLSVDGFFIAPADFVISATELNESDRISIDANGYVGIAAPAIVHQGGTPDVRVLHRSFDGSPAAIQTQLRTADKGKTWPLSGSSSPTTQRATATHLRLPSGLPDGRYEIVVDSLDQKGSLPMPVLFAGQMIDTLGPRVQHLQSFAKSLETASDPDLIALKPTIDHVIQFAQQSQRALSSSSGAPVADGDVRRQGLAEQEGAASTAVSLDRIRGALEQTEVTVAAVEAKRLPFEGRTGEFRLAYRSAVDGRLAVYRLYVPSSYTQAKQVPAVLFLHGGGGDENYWPELADGLILKMLEERGYIGIMPHWNRRSFGEHWMQDQLQLIDEVTRTWKKIDADRIYLTGISMGGGGTFRLAVAHPERFAAVCCVSGSGDPLQAANLKPIPIMIIHGGADNVSPPQSAVMMNEVLKSLGHTVSFHLFPLNGHNYHAEKYLGLTLDFFDAHRRVP